MGHVTHNAIIVTAYIEQDIRAAHEVAVGLGMSVTPVIVSNTNSVRTFLAGPDGSQTGWDEDEAGDERREKFKAKLEELRFEDGTHPLQWVEVAYSSDDRKAEVVADVWGTT